VEQLHSSVTRLEADKRDLILEVNKLGKEVRHAKRHQYRQALSTCPLLQGGNNLASVKAARDAAATMEQQLVQERRKMKEDRDRLEAALRVRQQPVQCFVRCSLTDMRARTPAMLSAGLTTKPLQPPRGPWQRCIRWSPRGKS